MQTKGTNDLITVEQINPDFSVILKSLHFNLINEPN